MTGLLVQLTSERGGSEQVVWLWDMGCKSPDRSVRPFTPTPHPLYLGIKCSSNELNSCPCFLPHH